MRSNDSSRAFATLFFTTTIILGWSRAGQATDNVVQVSFDRAKTACQAPLTRSAVNELSEAERAEIFADIFGRVLRTPNWHATIKFGADFLLSEWYTDEPERLRLTFQYEPGRLNYAIWVEGANPLVTYVIRDFERRAQLRELIAKRFGRSFMALPEIGERRTSRPRLMDAFVL